MAILCLEVVNSSWPSTLYTCACCRKYARASVRLCTTSNSTITQNKKGKSAFNKKPWEWHLKKHPSTAWCMFETIGKKTGSKIMCEPQRPWSAVIIQRNGCQIELHTYCGVVLLSTDQRFYTVKYALFDFYCLMTFSRHGPWGDTDQGNIPSWFHTPMSPLEPYIYWRSIFM